MVRLDCYFESFSLCLRTFDGFYIPCGLFDQFFQCSFSFIWGQLLKHGCKEIAWCLRIIARLFDFIGKLSEFIGKIFSFHNFNKVKETRQINAQNRPEGKE